MGIATFRLARERQAALIKAASKPSKPKKKKPTKIKLNGNNIN